MQIDAKEVIVAMLSSGGNELKPAISKLQELLPGATDADLCEILIFNLVSLDAIHN